MKTGVIKDPLYIEHDTGTYHPESPNRLKTLYQMLENRDMSWVQSCSPRPATLEEIRYIHTESYVSFVSSLENRARASLDPDTVLSPKSFQASLLAAGGVLTGIDLLMDNSLDNVFALVRPPGHHAEADHGKGFCIFNNVAIGAEYAMRRFGLDRILIIDWDLHHGNGTQHSFYENNRILYFSTHQFPYYPGTGEKDEFGKGKGKGYTVNVPLGIGCGDREFYKIFREILEPIANCFQPQLVLVSAGFDAYEVDPLGGMELTPAGFAAMTQVVMDISERSAQGRVLLTLEGGYNLKGLRDCVKQVLRQLNGKQTASSELLNTEPGKLTTREDYEISSVIKLQKRFWSCFGD